MSYSPAANHAAVAVRQLGQPDRAAGPVTVTWAVTAGSLPPGLSLDPSTRTITGAPAAQGLFNFSVVATNVATGSSKQGGTYNFVVYPAGG